MATQSAAAMLEYILRAVPYEAGCSKVIVVVGYGRRKWRGPLAEDKRTMVRTDRAARYRPCVRAHESEMKKGNVRSIHILAGDVPLIRGQVLKTLPQSSSRRKVVASMARPSRRSTGYGESSR